MASTPKTTAKRSQNTKSTTTPKVTYSAVMAHIATARSARLAQGAKANYDNEGAQLLAKAIVRASAMPAMSSEGITTDRSTLMAQARREFARKRKAHLLDVSDILGAGKDGEIIHDRPENTIRIRLASIAKAMGLPADTYYAVRAQSYVPFAVPQVYIVRK